MVWLGGGIPYGYSYNFQSRKLVRNQQEAAVLNTIFSLALRGKGVKEIANTLNKEGIKSRSGKKWSVTVVSALLSPTRLSFYRGYLDNIKGNWEPLLDEQKYRKLLQIRKKVRKEFAETHISHDRGQYLLTNIDVLKCGYCKGNAKAVKVKKAKSTFFYYLCSQKQTKGQVVCENSKTISQDIVDNIVLKYIRLFTGEPYIDKISEYIDEYKDKLFKDLTLSINNRLPEALDTKDIDKVFDELQHITSLISEAHKKIHSIKPPTPRGGRSWQATIIDNIESIELYRDKITITFKYPINNTLSFTIVEQI